MIWKKEKKRKEGLLPHIIQKTKMKENNKNTRKRYIKKKKKRKKMVHGDRTLVTGQRALLSRRV